MIYSNSLIRARETSEILAKATGCEIKIVSEFQGRNWYSFLSGMEKEEVREKYPQDLCSPPVLMVRGTTW